MRKFFLVVLNLTTVLSFGQTKDCDCTPSLNQNLKDKLSITHYNEFKDWLYQYFQKNETSRSLMKSKDRAKWAGKFSAVIDGLPMSGSSDADWAKFRDNQKFYKIEQTSVQSKYLTEEQFDQVLEEKFGANQLEGYKACLELCKAIKSIGNGITYVTGGDLQDEFFIQVSYNSTSGGQSITLKGPAVYNNLEPIGGLVFKDSLVIKDRQSVTQYFKRLNAEKSASFGLNTLENITTTPAVFDANPPINQQGIPIGTIVTSVLDYNKFLKANGLDVMDNDNMAKVLWIPCDGRTLSVSRYAQYSGGKIPDLRGVFLRGVNDYNVQFPGVVAVSENQKNPESTNAGVFQPEQIQEHVHNFTILQKDKTGGGCSSSLSGCGGGATTGTYTTEKGGGNETRPKNVSVYYYIKIN